MGVPNIKELIAKAQKEIPYEAPSACVNCDEFKKKDYGLQFLIVDQDGKPIAGREYFISLDDDSLTGRTDAEGKTEVVRKNKADKIAIHVLFEAPNRLIKREDVMPADGLAETSGIKQSKFVTDTVLEHMNGEAVPLRKIVVDDKAATRQAIILALREKGITFKTRSDWQALPPKNPSSDWNYTGAAIHHAGNSFDIAADGTEQMKKVQTIDLKRFEDAGYHYGIDGAGVIYEGRDIRYKGEHISQGNTGNIGIVLLADLSLPNEAWEEEYKNASLLTKIKGMPDWVSDGTTNKVDVPTKEMEGAAAALVDVLKSIFNIQQFGGHREFQLIKTKQGRACPGFWGMQIVKGIRHKTNLAEPSF